MLDAIPYPRVGPGLVPSQQRSHIRPLATLDGRGPFSKNEAAAHPHARAHKLPTIPHKRLFDRSDQSEAVLAQRGQDASSPRLLDNKGPGRIAAHRDDAKQPSSESAHTPGPVQSTLPSCSQAKRPLEQPRQRSTTRSPLVGSRSIHSCCENLASCLVRSPGWRIVQGRAQQLLGLPLLVVVWRVVCVPYRACMHQFALGGYLPIDCCSRASAATGPFCL